MYKLKISDHDYTVLLTIAGGERHERPLSDLNKIPSRTITRSTDRLEQSGFIALKPCRDPGRGGLGSRIISYKITPLGRRLLRLIQNIEPPNATK